LGWHARDPPVTDEEKHFVEVADRWYRRCLTARLPDVKVLLVDDLEENLFAFAQILQRDGLEIITARSGTAALEKLLVHEFALAIIDVHMPDMDGFRARRGHARNGAHPDTFPSSSSPPARTSA